MNWAIVLGYVIASSCLGIWHSHLGGAHACQHGVSHSLECHHDVGGPATLRTGDEQHRDSTPEGDCAACRFLAQSALPVAAVVPPTFGEMVAQARIVPHIRPAVWAATGGLARAPPCDA